jgi:hypothetical protein
MKFVNRKIVAKTKVKKRISRDCFNNFLKTVRLLQVYHEHLVCKNKQTPIASLTVVLMNGRLKNPGTHIYLNYIPRKNMFEP